MAGECEMSPQQVKRHLVKLRDMELLTYEERWANGGRQTSHMYRLRWNEGEGVIHDPLSPTTPSPGSSATPSGGSSAIPLEPSIGTVKKEPSLKPIDLRREVARAWLQNEGLPKHDAKYFRDPQVVAVMNRYIQRRGVPALVTAIQNYAIVLGSSEHYFDHKWTLKNFLERGLEQFAAEADPLTNFRRQAKSGLSAEDMYFYEWEGEEDDKRGSTEAHGDAPSGLPPAGST
jgi:hypothetical protein